MEFRRFQLFLTALLLPTLAAVAPASAETNADGSFSHSIPIPLPPGRAGVAPSLSIEYNSRSGNGELGVGWALAGLDKISRVRGPNGENPTYQWSSNNGMITQDALNYNGERMIRVAAGEYRLRHEGYTRIQQVCPGDYTINGASSCYWKVTTPDGWIREYGKTRDSAFIPAGGTSPHEWALNRVVDPNGNDYTVVYDYDAASNANGEYYPLRIEYTHSPGVSVFHSVNFIWEGRSDVDISYRGGNAPVMSGNVLTNPDGYFSKYTKRLAAIEVRSGTTLQRKFDFLYHDESGASCGAGAGGKTRLCSVRQYGTDGTTAYPPANFQYQGGNVAANYFTVVAEQNMNRSAATARWLTGDFNGDGRQDIAQVWEYSGLHATRFDSTGTGFVTKGDLDFGVDSAGALYYGTLDVNGDQKKDIVVVRRLGWNNLDRVAIRTCLANESGFDACVDQNPGQLGEVPYWTGSGGWQTVDVDGDGREDLVQPTEAGTTTTTYVYRSNGTGFNAATASTNSNIKQFPEWFSIDVNGDGKTDLLNMEVHVWGGNPDACERDLEDNVWQVFLANGTNLNTSYIINQNDCRAQGHSQFLPGDVNGDGLTDIVDYRNDFSVETYLSNGNGFRDPTGNVSSIWADTPGTEPVGQMPENEQRTMLDVNGDKRSDFVRAYAVNNDFSLTTYTSRGVFTAPEGLFNPPTTQTFAGKGTGHMTQLFVDVDGDGQSDVVQALNLASGWLWLRIYKATQPIPDLLTRIDNGSNGITAISYQSVVDHCDGTACAVEPSLTSAELVNSVPMGWPNVVDNSPRQVVSAVKSSPDNGSTYPYETRYTYYDGRRYLSTDWERRNKSLGFRWMTSREYGGGIAGNVDKTWWYQTTAIGADQNDDNFKIAGQKWIATKFDSVWARWGKTTYSYSVGGNITASQTAGAAQDTFARPSVTLEESYNAGTLTGTTKDESFYFGDTAYPAITGSVGQLAETKKSSSKADPATVSLDTRTVLKYRDSDVSPATCAGALISSPVRESSVYNASNQLLTASKTTYRSDCRADSTQSYYVEESRWITTSTIGYDTFGNATSGTDARGATTTTTYLSNTGSAFHQTLPISVTNHLLHSTSTAYDNYGRATTVTDANNVATTTSYDVLHRPISVVRNGFVQRSLEYPSFTETRQYAMTNNAAISQQLTTFVDGLGRESKTVLQSDDGSVAKNIYVCKQYDSKGRVSKQSLPSYLDCATNTVTYTNSFYDAQGRMSYQTHDDGRPRTDYIYSGPHTINGEAMVLQTVRVSQGSQLRDELAYTDSRGRTRRTIRGSGSATVTADFSYDVLGRPTSTVILNGSTVSFTFDSLGRKKTVTDTGNTPAGQTTYQFTYNDAGDLLKKVDAGGKTVSYSYDILGRIVRECLGVATCNAGTNPAVASVYDSAAYGKGKVASVSTPSSTNESATTTTYTYDNLGRSSTQTLQIDTQSFQTRIVYEGNDAIRCKINPDNSFIRYMTTARNGLPGMHPQALEFYDTSFAGDCLTAATPTYSIVFGGYDADGHPGTVEYRKGTTVANQSTRSFAAWGGLSSVFTRIGTAGSEVENLSYAYDGLLALSSITDQRTQTGMLGVDTNRSRAFRYDGMGRLVQAVSGYQSSCGSTTCTAGWSPGSFNRSYGFDAAGNLSSKEGYTFQFDAAMKQRLLMGQTGGSDELSYNYDNSGNVVGRVTCYSCAAWNYEYNHHNMMTSASYAGNLEERNTFIGEARVKKDYRPNGGSQRVQTYYANDQFEVRVSGSGTTTYTAYINAGGTLASFTRTGSIYASEAPIAPIGTPHDGPDTFAPVRVAVANVLVPNAGRFLGVALLGALALVLLRTRRGIASSKPTTMRFAFANALVVATLGFGVGCSGADIEHGDDAFEGEMPSLTTESLTGGTQSGLSASGYFFMNDYLGSPAMITSASAANLGQIVTVINHGPYGDVVNSLSGGPDVTTHKFTGQELDEETGLYNFGARMYAPEIGRFLAADTIIDGAGDGRGYLRYAYAKGNPVAYTDPTGHKTVCNDQGVCQVVNEKSITPPVGVSPSKATPAQTYDQHNGTITLPPVNTTQTTSTIVGITTVSSPVQAMNVPQLNITASDVQAYDAQQAAEKQARTNAAVDYVGGLLGSQAGDLLATAGEKIVLNKAGLSHLDSELPIADVILWVANTNDEMNNVRARGGDTGELIGKGIIGSSIVYWGSVAVGDVSEPFLSPLGGAIASSEAYDKGMALVNEARMPPATPGNHVPVYEHAPSSVVYGPFPQGVQRPAVTPSCGPGPVSPAVYSTLRP